MLQEKRVEIENNTYDDIYDQLRKKKNEIESAKLLFRVLKKEKVNIPQTCVSTKLKKKRSQRKFVNYIKQKLF